MWWRSHVWNAFLSHSDQQGSFGEQEFTERKWCWKKMMLKCRSWLLKECCVSSCYANCELSLRFRRHIVCTHLCHFSVHDDMHLLTFKMVVSCGCFWHKYLWKYWGNIIVLVRERLATVLLVLLATVDFVAYRLKESNSYVQANLHNKFFFLKTHRQELVKKNLHCPHPPPHQFLLYQVSHQL